MAKRGKIVGKRDVSREVHWNAETVTARRRQAENHWGPSGNRSSEGEQSREVHRDVEIGR